MQFIFRLVEGYCPRHDWGALGAKINAAPDAVNFSEVPVFLRLRFVDAVDFLILLLLVFVWHLVFGLLG